MDQIKRQKVRDFSRVADNILYLADSITAESLRREEERMLQRAAQYVI
jgi:hypothetical protein